MFVSVLHNLLSPLVGWHARYHSKVIADWLIANDADFSSAVDDFKPKREHYEMSQSARKSWRRKCLNRLRKTCADPDVRAIIYNRYPPLSGTWS
ncbi:MAG: hypothetical protein CMA72_07325 [Euryarchaeota archaeon]|nr:hypothetical protein [Euryarchaeota archaeon]